MFKDKKILITGGTGSFGATVASFLLKKEIQEIRIFSRDEKKQDDMRKTFKSNNLKFYLGDVRDPRSIDQAMRGVDYVFHAAALKQVPSCEFYPMQAVLTNIIGTENVIESAIKSNVKKVVCLSTDKAVYPINAMGTSKALMEKVAIASGRDNPDIQTKVCVTRYGNVMASRGSVIPLFFEQILKNEAISITDPEMTRFMMTLDDAVDLVIHALCNGENGDIFIQKAPASTVENLAIAIKDLLGAPNHPIKIIGARHGEKLHESIVSKEELARAIDEGKYFRIPSDARDLNYDQYFEKGFEKLTVKIHGEDYNSANAQRLNVSQMKELLLKVEYVKNILNG